MLNLNKEYMLAQFQLCAPVEELDRLRGALIDEIRKESIRQGAGDTEIMKLLCVYLCLNGDVKDVKLIWRAKSCSMDTSCAIEATLLCGAGVGVTLSYLKNINESELDELIEFIEEAILYEDIIEVTKEELVKRYSLYYGV